MDEGEHGRADDDKGDAVTAPVIERAEERCEQHGAERRNRGESPSQVGIDAITCGALNKECTLAHEWTIVNLGGSYYHCDVTFQLDAPNTLQYFGLNDAERELEGDWDMQYNNIGDLNEIWGSDLPITDTRFAEVWKCYYYEIDRDKNMLYCFSKGDGDIPYFEMSLK